MASSAGQLSFADDKLKHGGHWESDQVRSPLTVIGSAWIFITHLESCEI
jgi:hypothetical protein